MGRAHQSRQAGGAEHALYLAEGLERRLLLHGGVDHGAGDPAEPPGLLGSALSEASGSLEGQSGVAGADVAQGPVYNQLSDVPTHDDADCPLLPGPTYASGADVVNGVAPLVGQPAPGQRQPLAPGDFTMFRSTSLGTAATDEGGSTVNEPSVGTLNHAVFQTGNWYASVSGDNGASFRYISPYTTFPDSGTGFTAGFCCDQRVSQDEARDMVMWYLQYRKTGSTAPDTGGVRIARAGSTNDLLDNLWTYWSFTPASFGYAAGTWLDFPNMEVSNSFLYATSNLFTTTNDAYFGTVMWRIPLSQLQAGGSVNYTYWTLDGNAFALAPAQNAAATMYLGSIINANTTRLWRVADGDTTLSWNNIGGLAATNFGTHTSVTPSGNNWTGRADSRVQSAVVVGDTVTFLWNSAQGANRPQPFVRGLAVAASTNAVVAQPDIWNSNYAWQYPRFSVNARGHVSGVVAIGGGTWGEPGTQVILSDDLNSLGFSSFFAANGTASDNNRWGDYLGSQPDDNFPNTWVGSSFHRTGTTVQPYFFWWGRDRDNPSILSPVSDVGDTIATAANTGVASWGGSHTTQNPVWNPAHGRSDVDLFRLQANVGGQLTAQTYLPTPGGTAMDTMLRLFDSAGNPLAIDDDSGPDTYSLLAYAFVAAGTYYVGASGFSNAGYDPRFAGSGSVGRTGDYGISIALTDPDVPDTIGAAQPLPVGPGPGSTTATDPVGNGSFGERDVDVYRIDVAAGTNMVFETGLPAGGTEMDAYMRLFDAAGVPLAADDDGGPGLYSRIAFYAAAAGTYYLGISGFSNAAYNPGSAGSGVPGDRGDYVLSAQLSAQPAWLAPGSAATWDPATRALSVSGPSTIIADPAADAPVVTASGAAAVLTIAPPAGALVHLGGLTLANGAAAAVADAGTRRTLVIAATGGAPLDVDAASRLDLTDNAMVWRGGSLAAVQAAITRGRNGGDWVGAGIASNTAASNSQHNTAVGYASNAGLGLDSFEGVSGLTASDVLIRYTYNGDTNLDTAVNTDDIINILAAGKLDTGLSGTWFEGDMTFDGLINTDDIIQILAGGRLDQPGGGL